MEKLFWLLFAPCLALQFAVVGPGDDDEDEEEDDYDNGGGYEPTDESEDNTW